MTYESSEGRLDDPFWSSITNCGLFWREDAPPVVGSFTSAEEQAEEFEIDSFEDEMDHLMESLEPTPIKEHIVPMPVQTPSEDVQCSFEPAPIEEAKPSDLTLSAVESLPVTTLFGQQAFQSLLSPLVQQQGSLRRQVSASDVRELPNAIALPSIVTSSAPTATTAPASTLNVVEDSASSDSETSASTTRSSCSNQADYNHEQWNERYQELEEYKAEYGHCNVPYRWPTNPSLAMWVKRQRHQYSLKQAKKHTNLTNERLALLDSMGFTWDSRESNWDEKFEHLRVYKDLNGHVRVSTSSSAPGAKHVNKGLAVWLKRQRHNARKFCKGDMSTGMTERRLNKLLSLGVKLNARRQKC